MWVCRKCHQRATSSGRICRACGGILEEVPDEQPLAEEQVPKKDVVSASTLQSDRTRAEVEDDVLASEGRPTPPDESTGPEWRCPKCGELVPGNFDVCWKCMTTKEGEEDPDVPQLVSEGSENDQETESTFAESEAVRGEDAVQKITGCPRCGSQRTIPDVTVVDQGDSSDGILKTVVVGNPDALIFKNRLYGEIKADICGECGHIELRVANPSELYEHYQNSPEHRVRSSKDQEVFSSPCRRCGMLVVKGSSTCPHCGVGQHSD